MILMVKNLRKRMKKVELTTCALQELVGAAFENSIEEIVNHHRNHEEDSKSLEAAGWKEQEKCC